MVSPATKQIFDLDVVQLEEYRVGEHRGVAVKLSKMARAINRSSALLDPPGGVGRLLIPVVKMFKLQGAAGEDWDHITGNTWDGATQGSDDILILKPWDLRGTPFHGKTRNSISYDQFADDKRTASKTGEDDEVQWTIPSYQKDDIIFAIRNVHGGLEQQNVNADAQDARWMDINAAGRQWAKV